MRSFILGLFAALLALTSPAYAAAKPHYATAAIAPALQYFQTESAAQRHCPSDEIVWLNTKSGIWHEKGMRWYGRTRQGAYVCKKAAAAAGDRDTLNGQ